MCRVPWTARKSKQSILKEISPEYSLEGLVLKLKLQYFGHLMWRTDSMRPWCWERLKAGEYGDDRGWDGWMASPTLWTWVWVSSGSWWWTGKSGMLQSMGLQSQTGLNNWTELIPNNSKDIFFLNAYGKFSRIEYQSVQFSCSVVSDSLPPHGLQHARLPCPSPSPRVCPNSYPLSQWCHPTISSSFVPFSSCLRSFPASGSFQMSQLFTSGGQSIEVSASTPVLPMNIQDWFPLGLTAWISLQSKGLSRVFSNTTVQKHQFFGAQPSIWSNSHIHTWLLEKP